MQGSVFTELSLVIAIAVAVSLLMRIIRQPLTIGYILTGVLVGPAAFDVIHSTETLAVFSEFGIALLLLIVGLGMNPKVIKEVGKIAAFIAIGKVIVITSVGFLLSQALGFTQTEALFIGVGLSFSSTIIILKLLTDKKEQTRLYGKVAIGYLLVEDIIATVILVFVSSSTDGGTTLSDFTNLILKCSGLILTLWLVRALILPRLNNLIARSQEFLFLFAIGWGLGIATIFSKAGFSLEIGALIAGVMLASMPYATEVSSRLKPLRDFFVVLFFVSLGSHLELSGIGSHMSSVIPLSLLVLIGSPLIVMTLMGLGGYTKKTSFKAGLTGAQISEFSLILVLLAANLGKIDQHVTSIVTIIAFVTIAVSTYTITYADQLYNVFEKYIRMFERKRASETGDKVKHFDLVLLGYQKGGYEFVKLFNQLGKSHIVIDYNPNVIDVLESKQINYIYGDVTDPEMLQEVTLSKSKLVVSTITDFTTNKFLGDWLEKENQHAVYICTADTIEEASELYDAGASYVMLPHYIGSEKISSFIKRSGLKKSEFKKYRERHLAYLQTHYNSELEPEGVT